MISRLYFVITLFSLWSAISTKTNAQSPDWLWVKSMGGTSDDDGECMALDPSGNGDIYTTGNFYGSCDFDPGEETFNLTQGGSFISKLDAAGNFIWVKGFGGPEYFIEINSIAIDPGVNRDVYVTGWFSDTADFDPGIDSFYLTTKADRVDVFISKFDSSGNFQWAKAFGGPEDDEGISIAVDPTGSGDVFITGYFQGVTDFNPGAETFNLHSKGGRDIFISKFDGSGNFIWAKKMGGISDEEGIDISLEKTGKKEIYISGNFNGTADFNPGIDIYDLTAAGYADIFISKLDSTGNFIWAKAFGGIAFDGISSMVLDPSGNGDIYTTGFFRGSADFDPGQDTFMLISEDLDDPFISKLDASGNFLWAKAIKSPSLVTINSLVIDLNGDVYTAGVFEGFVDFDQGPGYSYLFANGGFDVYLAKQDASGNFLWAKDSDGGDLNNVGSMAIDDFGYVHVVGSFEEASISFDSITLTNSSSISVFSDIFIAKLDNLTTSVDHTNAEIIPISVYPNPVNTTLTIDLDKEYFDLNISIFNTLGEVVYSKTTQNISNKISIDMSKLASGIYFITFDIDGNIFVKKVIKE
jgi:hypothetical protein